MMTAEPKEEVACTVSRYKVPCIVCSGDIFPGDRMFCSTVQPRTSSNTTTDVVNVNDNDNDNDTKVKTKNTSNSSVWGHEACYDPNLPPPPSCRHWKRLGRCPAKEMGMCAFQHDTEEKGTSLSLDKQRWGGRRNFVRNQHKNSVFRIFLMQTYGMDYMNKSDGVIIDVAGGKGELSFELINLSGARECVVVDPRPLSLSLVQSKWEKGLYEPKRTGVFSKWYPACEAGCKERQPRSPGHLRCFFDGGSLLEFVNAKDKEEGEEIDDKTKEQFQNELERAKLIVWTTKGLQHEDGSSYNEENAEEDSTTQPGPSGKHGSNSGKSTNSSEVIDPTEAHSILSRCHLMVGFHPDQAAGEIIEFAMARGIPYCLVPCCVYSDTFSLRKLKDGTKVKSYDHLVQWLCEKDPRARTTTLDLEGKNTVVYTLPHKL